LHVSIKNVEDLYCFSVHQKRNRERTKNVAQDTSTKGSGSSCAMSRKSDTKNKTNLQILEEKENLQTSQVVQSKDMVEKTSLFAKFRRRSSWSQFLSDCDVGAGGSGKNSFFTDSAFAEFKAGLEELSCSNVSGKTVTLLSETPSSAKQHVGFFMEKEKQGRQDILSEYKDNFEIPRSETVSDQERKKLPGSGLSNHHTTQSITEGGFNDKQKSASIKVSAKSVSNSGQFSSSSQDRCEVSKNLKEIDTVSQSFSHPIEAQQKNLPLLEKNSNNHLNIHDPQPMVADKKLSEIQQMEMLENETKMPTTLQNNISATTHSIVSSASSSLSIQTGQVRPNEERQRSQIPLADESARCSESMFEKTANLSFLSKRSVTDCSGELFKSKPTTRTTAAIQSKEKACDDNFDCKPFSDVEQPVNDVDLPTMGTDLRRAMIEENSSQEINLAHDRLNYLQNSAQCPKHASYHPTKDAVEGKECLQCKQDSIMKEKRLKDISFRNKKILNASRQSSEFRPSTPLNSISTQKKAELKISQLLTLSFPSIDSSSADGCKSCDVPANAVFADNRSLQQRHYEDSVAGEMNNKALHKHLPTNFQCSLNKCDDGLSCPSTDQSLVSTGYKQKDSHPYAFSANLDATDFHQLARNNHQLLGFFGTKCCGPAQTENTFSGNLAQDENFVRAKENDFSNELSNSPHSTLSVGLKSTSKRGSKVNYQKPCETLEHDVDKKTRKKCDDFIKEPASFECESFVVDCTALSGSSAGNTENTCTLPNETKQLLPSQLSYVAEGRKYAMFSLQLVGSDPSSSDASHIPQLNDHSKEAVFYLQEFNKKNKNQLPHPGVSEVLYSYQLKNNQKSSRMKEQKENSSDIRSTGSEIIQAEHRQTANQKCEYVMMRPGSANSNSANNFAREIDTDFRKEPCEVNRDFESKSSALLQATKRNGATGKTSGQQPVEQSFQPYASDLGLFDSASVGKQLYTISASGMGINEPALVVHKNTLTNSAALRHKDESYSTQQNAFHFSQSNFEKNQSQPQAICHDPDKTSINPLLNLCLKGNANIATVESGCANADLQKVPERSKVFQFDFSNEETRPRSEEPDKHLPCSGKDNMLLTGSASHIQPILCDSTTSKIARNKESFQTNGIDPSNVLFIDRKQHSIFPGANCHHNKVLQTKFPTLQRVVACQTSPVHCKTTTAEVGVETKADANKFDWDRKDLDKTLGSLDHRTKLRESTAEVRMGKLKNASASAELMRSKHVAQTQTERIPCENAAVGTVVDKKFFKNNLLADACDSATQTVDFLALSKTFDNPVFFENRITENVEFRSTLDGDEKLFRKSSFEKEMSCQNLSSAKLNSKVESANVQTLKFYEIGTQTENSLSSEIFPRSLEGRGFLKENLRFLKKKANSSNGVFYAPTTTKTDLAFHQRQEMVDGHQKGVPTGCDELQTLNDSYAKHAAERFPITNQEILLKKVFHDRHWNIQSSSQEVNQHPVSDETSDVNKRGLVAPQSRHTSSSRESVQTSFVDQSNAATSTSKQGSIKFFTNPVLKEVEGCLEKSRKQTKETKQLKDTRSYNLKTLTAVGNTEKPKGTNGLVKKISLKSSDASTNVSNPQPTQSTQTAKLKAEDVIDIIIRELQKEQRRRAVDQTPHLEDCRLEAAETSVSQKNVLTRRKQSDMQAGFNPCAKPYSYSKQSKSFGICKSCQNQNIPTEVCTTACQTNKSGHLSKEVVNSQVDACMSSIPNNQPVPNIHVHFPCDIRIANMPEAHETSVRVTEDWPSNFGRQSKQSVCCPFRCTGRARSQRCASNNVFSSTRNRGDLGPSRNESNNRPTTKPTPPEIFHQKSHSTGQTVSQDNQDALCTPPRSQPVPDYYGLDKAVVFVKRMRRMRKIYQMKYGRLPNKKKASYCFRHKLDEVSASCERCAIMTKYLDENVDDETVSSYTVQSNEIQYAFLH